MCLLNRSGKALLILFTALLVFAKADATPGIAVSGTYFVDPGQVPSTIKKHSPWAVLLVYHGPLIKSVWREKFMKEETIINLKGFIDSTKGTIAYRLVFSDQKKVDSAWEMDSKYELTLKAYPVREGLLKILTYEKSKLIDQFVFDYGLKYRSARKQVPHITSLLQHTSIYTLSDRNDYTAASAWVLSIGIDDYGGGLLFGGCKADAERYSKFFRDQYISQGHEASGYHDYTLVNKAASRETILNVLKEIAGKARPNDYFIFNFAGYSDIITHDSIKFQTHFFPFDSTGNVKEESYKIKKFLPSFTERLISLKVLQEHIQLIQAKKQLFISEAGRSTNFKSEFIKTMMQNSPAISAMLNVNRVIMVPTGLGYEIRDDKGEAAGLLAYGIASLDTSYNIYNIFGDDRLAMSIVGDIKTRVYQKRPRNDEYFDVFFEKKFLQQYQDIFGDEMHKTRGGGTVNKQVQQSALKGNRHALVIGTDIYKGKGWDALKNPIYDATEISGILKEYYDYEVQLLKNPPMDSIYKAIRDYYKTLQPDDKLIIYVAGHGDYDKDLLDDGFIVCTDSRSVEDDPLRNTYIQHTKLKKMINKIPAKQILVLLDICHGGVFDEEVRSDPSSRITNRNVLELLRTNSAYTVRKVLSSVGMESAFDGQAGKHSPFAAYLINILNAKGGVEGIVTLSDILALLQKASLNETATLKISPHLADFGSNDPLGEFILIPVETKDK